MRTTERAFARAFARFLCVTTALLTSILAASCNNDYAVYQNVSKEQKQNGTSIFQKTICTNAFMLNSNYYAATSKLYYSPVHFSTGTASWTLVPITCLGSRSSAYTLRSAVIVGGTIYALTGDDSSSVALSSSTDGSTWTPIASLPSPLPVTLSSKLASGIPSSFVFDALYSAGGQLYAEANFYDTSSGGAVGISYYFLYYYTGSAWQQVKNFGQYLKNSTIRGVVADNDTSPTNFYFASQGQLYEGSSADGTGASSIVGNFSSLSSKTIWAISYTGNHLYVSTTDGNLYQDNGNPEQVDSSSRPLTKVISVPFSNPSSIILVGTDTNNVNTAACGYYEGTFGNLDLGSSSQDVCSSAVYSTTVSVFPAENFFYDSTNKNLFVCIAPGYTSTSYYGLYEVTWNGTSWSNGWEAQ